MIGLGLGLGLGLELGPLGLGFARLGSGLRIGIRIEDQLEFG